MSTCQHSRSLLPTHNPLRSYLHQQARRPKSENKTKQSKEIMLKLGQQLFLVGCVAVLVLAVISSQATAFTPLVVVVRFAAGPAPHTQRSPRHALVNMAHTITALSAASDENEEDLPTSTSSNVSKSKDKSIFDKINAALDTPILDANERSDQGAIAEALKGFVRSEPEVASITFSAVLVVFLFILVRFFNFLSYGI